MAPLPNLLFCHPTGFHAMVWEPLAAHLAGVARCWALDFRGHGDSTLPTNGPYDWHGMADDVLAVADHLRAADPTIPILGVGHSMGGAALLLAEQARPGTWAALWCYEPIIFPPFEGPVPEGGPPLAAVARRRTAVFADRESALANYASKPPLSRLHPDALQAYVDYGFRDLPDGGVELKCAPEIEARIFENGVSHGGFGHLAEVACPTTVAAGGDGSPPARVAPVVADALPQGHLVTFPQLSHFGPMEDPAAVAAVLSYALLGHEKPYE